MTYRLHEDGRLDARGTTMMRRRLVGRACDSRLGLDHTHSIRLIHWPNSPSRYSPTLTCICPCHVSPDPDPHKPVVRSDLT